MSEEKIDYSKGNLISGIVKNHPRLATYLLLGLVGIVGALLGALGTSFFAHGDLATKSDIQNIADRLNDYEERTISFAADVARVEQQLKDTVVLIYATSESLSVEEADFSITGTYWSNDTVIGVDQEGNEIFAQDKIGQTVLMVYEENGLRVYFLGQYNGNYHWDGYCVTNVYDKENRLCGICESDFKDGKRENYLSLVRTNDEIIRFANRQCGAFGNSGMNVEYEYVDFPQRMFDDERISARDILYVNDVTSTLNLKMKQYYSGNTVDERYEDESGRAYLIKYDEAGKVVFLYKGQFKNGQPNDKSGNAYSIVYDEEYNAYFHNYGRFENGYAKKHGNKPLTEDEIDQIIGNDSFDVDLVWISD